MTPIINVPGIGPHLAEFLSKKGIETAEELAATLPAALTEIPGIGAQRANTLLKAANLALKGDPPKSSEARKAPVAFKAKQPSPAQAEPAVIANGVESKAAKKAKAKKVATKKKAAAKKAIAKKKLEEKASAKKAAKRKVNKKATKKKAKSKKRKKNGKSKKK